MGLSLAVRVTVFSLSLLAAQASAASNGEAVRVRREMRSLTPAEYSRFVQGLGTMMSISTAAGAAIFGPQYKEYDYFIVKHAINTMARYRRTTQDDNGTNITELDIFDLAHFGPWFITFHAALCLEFENALLSVVPDLKALPYWEMYEDLLGTPKLPGRYYHTSKSMFSSKYAGSLNGDAASGYSVRDGVFAGRMISRFDFIKYANVSHIFNGSKLGLLRSFNNDESSPYVVRYPAANLVQVPWFEYYAAGLELNFTREDLARCTNISHVRNAWEFILCMDFSAASTSGLQDADPNVTAKWLNSVSSYNHNLLHATVAGVLNGSYNPDTGFAFYGDVQDLATSLNESFLFFPFHANLVRAFMIWQRAITAADPNQAKDSVLWGYPQSANLDAPPYAWPGTELDALISPPMPFQDVFQRSTQSGITHRDVLIQLMDPVFTYDKMLL